MKTIAMFLTATLAAAALAAGQQIFPPLHYGQWGFDQVGIDRQSQPGDDFFAYANGKWLASTPIPPNSDRATLRALIDDRTNLELRALLEEAAKSSPRAPVTTQDKVGAVYRSFMYEQRIERLGAQPIAADLARLRALMPITPACRDQRDPPSMALREISASSWVGRRPGAES